MATPKKKTIKKTYCKDLQLDFYTKISAIDLNARINRLIAEIEVEMEGDGIGEKAIEGVADAACIEFNREYSYGSDPDLRATVSVSANITRMETQKEADLRERRSEKAKKSREENLRKEKEREMKVLERLRKKYGVS